jgi:hypothetical protein
VHCQSEFEVTDSRNFGRNFEVRRLLLFYFGHICLYLGSLPFGQFAIWLFTLSCGEFILDGLIYIGFFEGNLAENICASFDSTFSELMPGSNPTTSKHTTTRG